MRILAYILAVISLVVAVMYFAMQAGSLPTFMPGYEAGSTHIHMKHAIGVLVVAIILFVVGWFAGRART